MPIANTPLTAVQFEALQQNITEVYRAVKQAGTVAQSGLQYVVNLQVAAPEVDLVVPFYQQFVKIDGLDSISNFTTIAASLNLHAISRGATANGDLSTRLNEYLARTDSPVLGPVLVTQDYASISAQAGFIIDPSYIDAGFSITTLTLPSASNGISYSHTIATNYAGGGTLRFYVIGNLPNGLSLGQTSGTVSGTPTVNGTYAFKITVEDTVGSSAEVDYVVVVS